MAKDTKIAWCKSTLNPWVGCSKVGPGCDHCYAEALDKRMRFSGATHWGPGVPRHRTSAANWAQPLKWNRQAPDTEFAGRKGFWPVFCASLADVFDNEIPVAWRYDLWTLIEATPNLSWLLTTKRVGNVNLMVPESWRRDGFPPNVRVLATIVNQEEADRDIPKLLALPCKNGISYEPALGPVDWSKWLAHQYQGGHDTGGAAGDPCSVCGIFTTGMHHPYARGLEWIIVGGESAQGGAQARPFDISWARSTIAQCKAAGVPAFVKQLGRYPCPESDDLIGLRVKGHGFYLRWPQRYCDEDERISVDLKDRAGADPAEWPEDLRVREFPR